MKSPNLRIILFSLMVILVLVSCQSAPPQPSEVTVTATARLATQVTRTAQPQPSATPQPTATLSPYLDLDISSLRGMQINFWHPWHGDLSRRVEDAAREFNRSNPWGVTVRSRAMGSLEALSEELNTFTAVTPAESYPLGDTPTVLVAPPEDLAAWLAAGYLTPLDGYITHPEWALSEPTPEEFRQDFWQQDQFHAVSGIQQSGIPALRSGHVLFYNETWAGELGFSQPPTTPEEFKAQACAAAQANNTLTDSSKHFTGGWLINTDALTMLSWLDSFDAQVLPVTEGAAYTFQSVEAGAAALFLRDLFDEGCAWEGRSPTPYEYFTNRMALFYSGTFQDLAIQAETQQRLNSGDFWKLLAYPTGDGSGNLYSSGYSYGIVAADPEQQLAGWLFVRWMSAPERQVSLAESYPSFPVSKPAEKALSDDQSRFPWMMILPLEPASQAAPSVPTWRKVRLVLEDAALMQLFRLPADQMPFFLPELDKIASEVLQNEIEK